MYTTTKYTKEAIFPHTGTWTLNEFVLVGGDATSDNLPPRFSQIQYAWRSPALDIQQQIYAVLERKARQVAQMTSCRTSVSWVTKTRVGLTNHTMMDLTCANMEFVGAKTIAATLLDLLTEPTLLQQAQDELRDRTGGGVGGTKWVPAASAEGFRAAGRSALARIHPDRARRGMVDPDPNDRLRRRRPALIRGLTIPGPAQVI